MIDQFFLDKRPHQGQNYEEYQQLFNQKIAFADYGGVSNDQKKLIDRDKLNYQRSLRIHKTYSVDPQLCELVINISEPQLWMVITENWCGDSAQNLPYLAKIASCNPLIDFRIILRDDNLDIMDLYLTDNNSRSIPKFIAFKENGEELFQWGPRPNEAQELVYKLKSEGKSKDEYLEELHLWYGRNKGKNLESEIINILKSIF